MHPILFYLGELPVYTYGFVMMVVLILLYWLAARNPEKGELDAHDLSYLSLLVVVAIWFGDSFWRGIGGLLAFVPGLETVLRQAPLLPQVEVSPRLGGLQQTSTLAVGAFLGVWLPLYCRWRRLRLLPVLDFFLPYALLGYGLQRLFGCFAAGCCHGTPTDLPWAVRFPETFGIGPEAGVAVHPSQLYMGFLALLAFSILAICERCQARVGMRSGGALTGLFGPYFLVSFVRGDLNRVPVVLLGLSPLQLASLGLFLTGVLLMIAAAGGLNYSTSAPAPGPGHPTPGKRS
ncbi:MAG: prolipoprotein diacylglyceryl transferase [Magnetococcales bacterium]|nr:prolipoprotein diacylglyceryl transferase [Magnetococcales bacterium]MBF0156537.1 prolipoprotein diacylglyceryl transferase [Magnetococcales bacterium]